MNMQTVRKAWSGYSIAGRVQVEDLVSFLDPDTSTQCTEAKFSCPSSSRADVTHTGHVKFDGDVYGASCSCEDYANLWASPEQEPRVGGHRFCKHIGGALVQLGYPPILDILKRTRKIGG